MPDTESRSTAWHFSILAITMHSDESFSFAMTPVRQEIPGVPDLTNEIGSASDVILTDKRDTIATSIQGILE